MEAKSFVDNHPAHPLPAAIRQLLRLLEECSPDSQPEPQLLLTLERLLTIQSCEGDYSALAGRVRALEKKVELLGIRTVGPKKPEPNSFE